MNQASHLAVVTGSSRGIGRSISESLLNKGWDCYLTGRTLADVEAACNELKKYDGKPLSFVGDLLNSTGVDQLAKEIRDYQRPLELLVANIGDGSSSSDLQTSSSEIRRLFEINFFSAVMVCERLIPLMSKGNIIFISSIAGCEAIGAPLGYSAAKSALLAYSKGLSNLLAPRGIRVNAISPGNVMIKGGVWDRKVYKDSAGTNQYIRDSVPLNRFAAPEEIAEGVQFILQNAFYTGQNLIIDGGQTHGFA